MNKRSTFAVAVGLCAAQALSCGGGDEATPSERVSTPLISGADDRIEAMQTSSTDLITYNMLFGTFAQWLGSTITDNGNGTSSVQTTPYTTTDTGQPLCKDVKFYGQPQGIGLACTTFLVGPDLVATAGHCINHNGWPLSAWRYFWGYASYGSGIPIPTSFLNRNIYSPANLVASGVNAIPSGGNDDWALVRLDRPVAPGRVFPVAQQSRPTSGAYYGLPLWPQVATFGYGEKLALKYDVSNAQSIYFSNTEFYTPLDIFPGDSGSPIFDTYYHAVHGITTGTYAADWDLDASGTCWRPHVVSPTGQLDSNGQNPYVIGTFTDELAAYLRPSGTRIDPEYLVSIGQPSVVAPASNGLDYVFTTAADDNVYYKTRTSPSGAWTTWSEIPGTVSLAANGPSAVEGEKEIWVFARGANGQLYYDVLNETTNTWAGWASQAIGSGISVGASPSSLRIDQPTTRPVVFVSVVDTTKIIWTKLITYTPGAGGTYTSAGMSNAWSWYGPGATPLTGAQFPGSTSAILTYVSTSNVPYYLGVANQTSGGLALGAPISMATVAHPVSVLNIQPFVATSNHAVTFAARDVNDQLQTATSSGSFFGNGTLATLSGWTSAGTSLFDTPSFTSKGVMHSFGVDQHVYALPLAAP